MTEPLRERGVPVTGGPRQALFVVQLLAVLCVLALGTGAFYILVKLKKAPPEKETPENTVSVRVYTVEPADVRLTVSAEGTVDFVRRVLVRAQVAGKIMRISPNLKVGRRVVEGERLVEIDKTDYQLALDSARADLAIQEASIERLQLDQKNRQATVETLRDDLKLTEADLDRVRDLLRSSAASQADVDNARRAVLGRKNALEVYDNALALIPAQIRELNARIEHAELAVERASVDLARTEIASPFDALVVDESVEIGQLLQPNNDIAVLGDDSVMEVTAALDLSDLPNLLPDEDHESPVPSAPNAPATVIWYDLDRRHEWPAAVTRLGIVNAETRTIPVVAELRNPSNPSPRKPPLLAGMYCHLLIEGPTIPDALAIPRSALREGNLVYLERDGRLVFAQVSIRHTQDDSLIIASGLSPGDRVVLTNLSFPTEGMPIAPLSDSLGDEPLSSEPTPGR